MLTLIKGALLYTPARAGQQDLLIGGGKILKIAPDIKEKDCPSWGTRVIDAGGKAVFPGLIDAHVHLIGGGGEGGWHTRTPEAVLTDLLLGGVTTVVGCLGTDGITRSPASLLAKVRGLEEEGITAYMYTGSYQVPVRTLTNSIIDDLILIDKVIGTGEIAIADHRSSQPSKEEFAKIVADTRVGGILSGKGGLVNIHMGDGKARLSYLRYIAEETEIPVSQMLPTHINRSMELMLDGIDYAKTLGGSIDLTTSSDPDFLEEDEVKASTGFKMALDAGTDPGLITFSSDGQGSMPVFDKQGNFAGLGVGKVSSLYREFTDSVLKEGIPMETALKAVTENPAKLLKLTGKGRIMEGLDADMVLADKDTLALDMVLAKGHIMVRDKKPVMKGTFEK